MKSVVNHLESRILKGGSINIDEALELAEIADSDMEIMQELLNASDRIRKEFNGDKISLCTIINAKSGSCGEDCTFCAQSVHYDTRVDEYPLLDENTALNAAKDNERYGVHRFSLVTSGRGLDDYEFQHIIKIIKRLKAETKLEVCASLGFITYERALELKKAGLENYHNNTETSRNYFARICSTHTYDDKIRTIKNALKAGLNVC